MKQLVALIIKFLPAEQRDTATRWASIVFAIYEVYVYFSDSMNDEVLIYLLVVFIIMALPGTLYYRIAAKFSKTACHWHFYIPLYNYYLLCRCAKLAVGYALLLVLPVVAQVIWMGLFPSQAKVSDDLLVGYGLILMLTSLVQFVAIMHLWGSLAQYLGKSYWKYALLTPLTFYIPVFVLAFDKSKVKSNQMKSSHALLFSQGEYAGELLELPTNDFMMGHDSTRVQLVFNDPDVSCVHLCISVTPQGYEVEDMKTTQGTLMQVSDGSWQVLSGKKSLIRGLKLKLGSNVFEVQ